MKPLLFSIVFLLSLSTQVKSQSHSEVVDNSHSFQNFRVAVLLGHTLVPARHSPEHVTIPSWGIDLEYWFHHSLGLGFHNDLELQTFIVEKENMELLEREYPLVVTFDVLYKPWKDLVLQIGPGIEFEPSENLTLIRFGLEYEIEFMEHWDLAPSFFYDTRRDAFDTWSIAFGVGRRF